MSELKSDIVDSLVLCYQRVFCVYIKGDFCFYGDCNKYENDNVIYWLNMIESNGTVYFGEM